MTSSIRLKNFRSYKDVGFEFESGVNIVVGPNASGKTNLLESILVLCSGGSYRARDVDLVKFNKDFARLEGIFGQHKRVVKIEAQGEKVQKNYELDGKVYKRLSLERTVPVVVFEPNHLQLISRGPEQRRDFFDDILVRTTPGFKNLSASYRRALAQRNALLKQGQARAQKQLFAWDVRLSELGAQLVHARLRLLEAINQELSKTYSKIAGRKSTVRLDYETTINTKNYSSRLLSKLASNATTDFERGFTSHGPHREDITIYLADQPASITASRGETRSLLLALKVFELKLLERFRDQKPLFLLDDVFSELDGARRKHLVDYLKDYQTFITTTDAEAVIEYFSGKHNLISL